MKPTKQNNFTTFSKTDETDKQNNLTKQNNFTSFSKRMKRLKLTNKII
jgi:hypothetical protein